MTTTKQSTIHVAWTITERLAILIAGAYIVYRLRTVVMSVMISAMLTYIMLPAVNWLCRSRIFGMQRKNQRLLATAIVFILFVVIVITGITYIVRPFTNEISLFGRNFGHYSTKIGDYLETAGDWYSKVVPSQIREAVNRLDYSSMAAWVTSYIQKLIRFITSSVGVAMELLLIPVLVFYFLYDYKSITAELYGLVPQAKRRDAVRIGRRLGRILQTYVVGQLILCAVAGVLTGAFLRIFELPYVLVLAVFAAVTRAIPVIGPVVSGIPIVLVGLLYSTGYNVPFSLLIFVIVMHFWESKFLMPRLIGDMLHLHPAMVIVTLLIGAEFFGLIGMLLAAPVAAILRDIIRFYYVRPNNTLRRVGMGEDIE